MMMSCGKQGLSPWSSHAREKEGRSSLRKYVTSPRRVLGVGVLRGGRSLCLGGRVRPGEVLWEQKPLVRVEPQTLESALTGSGMCQGLR